MKNALERKSCTGIQNSRNGKSWAHLQQDVKSHFVKEERALAKKQKSSANTNLYAPYLFCAPSPLVLPLLGYIALRTTRRTTLIEQEALLLLLLLQPVRPTDRRPLSPFLSPLRTDPIHLPPPLSLLLHPLLHHLSVLPPSLSLFCSGGPPTQPPPLPSAGGNRDRLSKQKRKNNGRSRKQQTWAQSPEGQSVCVQRATRVGTSGGVPSTTLAAGWE